MKDENQYPSKTGKYLLLVYGVWGVGVCLWAE